MSETRETLQIAELAADIVSAYVSNNTVVRTDLPNVIVDVAQALATASAQSTKPPHEKLTPAVPIKKSVTPDFLFCLEDGKKFKSLKRHLRTHYKLTPEEYREKWSLPYDYPMVAPNYAKKRSSLAKKIGLGQLRK